MKAPFPAILLFACAALFAGTFYLLLKGRFETGDVYPPSSSLRSDPLGGMILFESLQALPGIQVTRDHRAANRLPEGKRTTYFQLAARSNEWESLPAETFRILDQFLLEGGRLVIALSPEYVADREALDKSEASKEEDKAPAEEEKAKADSDGSGDFVSLRKKWGLSFSREVGESRERAEYLAKNVSPLALPAESKWHGEIILKDPGPAWSIIYHGREGPVMAEMKRGEGSVVVATDSYFASNEALVRDRQPALLAWLVGSSDHVVFDESHFGILESSGIAALVRKYRISGGVCALLALAGLFIWKNSASLAPARATERGEDDTVAGRNSAAGFIGLLRRNIPKDRVFDVCLQEWQKSSGSTPKLTLREKSAVDAIVCEENARPAGERDPVAAWQRIHAALSRSAPKPNP